MICPEHFPAQLPKSSPVVKNSNHAQFETLSELRKAKDQNNMAYCLVLPGNFPVGQMKNVKK